MPKLANTNHELFAREFVRVRDASEACAKTFGKRKGPASAVHAHELLARPEVAARVRELTDRMLKASDITMQRVMLELGRVAFGDIRGAFDEHGQLKPIHELDDDTAACISGIEVEERPAEVVIDNESGAIRTVVPKVKKLKRYDKNPALGLLAKHFKIVGDEGDGTNALASALADRLQEARRRLATTQVRLVNSETPGEGESIPRAEGAIPPVAETATQTNTGIEGEEAAEQKLVPTNQHSFAVSPAHENEISKNLHLTPQENGIVQNPTNPAPGDDDERLW